MKATARIYFQKSPAKKTVDELCPVKLCVTYNRIRKYYSISKKIKNNDWLFIAEENIPKVMNAKSGKPNDIRLEYKRIVDEAETIINGLSIFSFNLFEEKYLDKVQSWDNVFMAMIDQIKTLKAEERFSYAMSFESTLRSIKEFHEGKKLKYNCRDKVESRYNDYLTGKTLLFVDITSAWLKRFEAYLHKAGKSRSTIGIYVRNIRVIVNLAINIHNIKMEYPFKQHKPKTSEGRKIALPAYQISQIANYKTDDPQEQFYRDLFMFSFWANGMNLTDVARLRHSNIIDNEICFVRRKTMNEEANESKIYIPITKALQAIIDKHGNKAVGFDSYLFPILTEGWDEEKIFLQIRQCIKMTNKYLKYIASRIGIKEKLTTYVGRHSWATIAKNSGASAEFISESLGHSSVLITKSYLKSFEKKTRQEHSKNMENIINTAI